MRPARRLLAPLLAGLTLAACTVAEPPPHGELVVPARYARSTADAAAPFPEADWWHRFGSARLDGLITQAEANNPDLSAAAARIAAADASLRASGADLAPGVGASGDAGRSATPFASGGDSGPESSFSLGLRASYELDLWGANRAGVEAARARALASRFDREAVALSLVSEVALTHFRVVGIDEQIDATRRSLALAREVQAITEARERAGATSSLESAQQRSVIAGLEAGITELRRARAEQSAALSVLLGAPPTEDAGEPGESLSALSLPLPSPGLPSDLLYRRPDLRAAEAGLDAAAADIEIARAAFLPTVSLTASGTSASGALGSLLDPAGFAFALTGAVAQTIFDNGATAAGVELGEAQRVALLEEYRAAVLGALRDVEVALSDAGAQAAIEAARQQALASARTAQAIAEAQYRAGSIDFINLLETQRSLIDAETDAILARQARLEAAVALYRALGGGYDPAAVAAPPR